MIRYPIWGTLALTTALQIGSPTRALADPIILNGGFETGELAPWFQAVKEGVGEDWNVTSRFARSGVFSATGTTGSSIWQNVDPVPGDLVTLSYWVRQSATPTGTPGSLGYVLRYTNGFASGASFANRSIDRWEFFQFSVAAPSGSQLITLILFGDPRVRTLYDDVNIEAVPEPATVWLLATGVACCMLRRRRFLRTLDSAKVEPPTLASAKVGG